MRPELNFVYILAVGFIVKRILNSYSLPFSVNVMRYGDLELFLSGLECSNLIPTFQQHQVTFADFLKMSDHDLMQVSGIFYYFACNVCYPIQIIHVIVISWNEW